MKRKTKAQRDSEQKAALLRRVHDVYSGALGGVWDIEDFASAAELARVVPALRDLLGPQFPDRTFPFQPHCLHHFDRPAMAAEFLYREGFRA